MMRQEVEKLLQEKESCFGDCFMIKTPLKPHKKTWKTMVALLVMLFLSFVLVLVVVFPKVDVLFLEILYLVFLAATVFFAFASSFTEPGYLKRNEKHEFL